MRIDTDFYQLPCLGEGLNASTNVVIVDAFGKKHISKTIFIKSATAVPYVLDLQGLPSGRYVLIVYPPNSQPLAHQFTMFK